MASLHHDTGSPDLRGASAVDRERGHCRERAIGGNQQSEAGRRLKS